MEMLEIADEVVGMAGMRELVEVVTNWKVTMQQLKFF